MIQRVFGTPNLPVMVEAFGEPKVLTSFKVLTH